MRRSLSRRHSNYSTDSERCRYQCGVEKKMTHYLFCYVPMDGLASPKNTVNEGDAQPDVDK